MKQFILFAVILIIGAMFLTQQVLALTVSPVRFEIDGYPGKILVGEIKLFNEQPITRVFYSSSMNFEARGEGATPHFLPGEEGLASWITTDYKRVSLDPGERKTIPFEIRIPKDAAPGGHFGVIFWSTAPPEALAGGQVAIGTKVGILVLLGVYGDIAEIGDILEFQTKQRILTDLPVAFFYRFANDGGDRVMPKGEIEVKSILGFRRAIVDANPVLGNVLPGSIRKFEVEWEAQNGIKNGGIEDNKGFWRAVGCQWRNFAFGVYTANLNLTWGEGKTSTASWWFIVIPWQLLTVILVILLTISLVTTTGIKRYNRWIIAKAMATKTKTKAKTASPEIKTKAKSKPKEKSKLKLKLTLKAKSKLKPKAISNFEATTETEAKTKSKIKPKENPKV